MLLLCIFIAEAAITYSYRPRLPSPYRGRVFKAFQKSKTNKNDLIKIESIFWRGVCIAVATNIREQSASIYL